MRAFKEKLRAYMLLPQAPYTCRPAGAKEREGKSTAAIHIPPRWG